ncbi:MAG: ABC transporter permease [Lachnospiraceae bacterium]|nr:ABC transporter permease [Lachnospiraceae bacterium]
MKKTYFKLQCKRNFHSFPGFLLGILLLSLFGVIPFLGFQESNFSKIKPQSVGIVIDESDNYAKLLLPLLSGTESINKQYTFVALTPDKLEKKFSSGKISMAFIIPKNYVKDMINGNVKPITVQYGTGDTGLASLLLKELCSAAATIILDTEKGIYALDEYYFYHNLPNQPESERKLNIDYIKRILMRNTLFEEKEATDTKQMQYTEYYFAVIMVLLFCFIGILAPGMFKSDAVSLEEKLHVEGFSYTKQSILKHLSIWLFAVASFGVLFFVVSVILGNLEQLPNDFEDYTVSSWIGIFIPMLLALPMVCTLIRMVYEWISDASVSMLFLFLGILLFGYFSGFFYPYQLLPKIIQKTAVILPTKVSLDYVSQCVTGDFRSVTVVSLLCYTLFLLFFSIAGTNFRHKNIIRK